MLSEVQKEKYSRQALMVEFDEKNMEKLFNAAVLVIGAGGLGSPVLFYLTAAGVGKIGIVENDTIVLHNLQRQILYEYNDIGKKKIKQASDKLRQFNPDTNIIEHNTWWTMENAKSFCDDYDIIVDCSDNIESRLVSNKCSKKHNIPFVFGAINGWEGQVSVFNAKEGKDYSKTFGIDENRATEKKANGVLGVTASTVGGIMASEVLKIIIGKGQSLSGKLLHINLLNNQWNIYNI